jgi:hypothetical protein
MAAHPSGPEPSSRGHFPRNSGPMVSSDDRARRHAAPCFSASRIRPFSLRDGALPLQWVSHVVHPYASMRSQASFRPSSRASSSKALAIQSLYVCSARYRTRPRYKQSSSDGADSHLSTFTADPQDCPDTLVSTFADASDPGWRALEANSQSTLRKRLLERDGEQCVLTGVRGSADVAHFLKPTHPFWVPFLT